MQPLLVAAAISLAGIGAASAQMPYPGSMPPQYDPDLFSWRYVAPTPEDAYREGYINRWQLEQLEGPTPQALQGPSPNGEKGDNPP